jgi:hypothetical protein
MLFQFSQIYKVSHHFFSAVDLNDETVVSKKRDRLKRLAHCQFCDKNLCDSTELYRHANHFHRVTLGFPELGPLFILLLFLFIK